MSSNKKKPHGFISFDTNNTQWPLKNVHRVEIGKFSIILYVLVSSTF